LVLYAVGFSIPDIELSWRGVQKVIDGVIGTVVDWPAYHAVSSPVEIAIERTQTSS
jgi:hypothetical protein